MQKSVDKFLNEIREQEELQMKEFEEKEKKNCDCEEKITD
jgi:hypothetical protein